MPKRQKSAETRAKEKNLRSQLQQNKLKMQQISDKMVAEKRSMTPEEETEMANLHPTTCPRRSAQTVTKLQQRFCTVCVICAACPKSTAICVLLVILTV